MSSGWAPISALMRYAPHCGIDQRLTMRGTVDFRLRLLLSQVKGRLRGTWAAYITDTHASQHEAKHRHNTGERRDRIDYRVSRHAGPARRQENWREGRTN